MLDLKMCVLKKCCIVSAHKLMHKCSN
jgi:hypothetical protein